MAFKHGIYIQEAATPIQAMINVATPTVIIGVAPVHTSTIAIADASAADGDAAGGGDDITVRVSELVNNPILIHNMDELQQYFGYDSDSKWTLCAAARIFFEFYNVAPVICINVFNPTTHKTGSSPDVTKVTAADIEAGLNLIDSIYPRLGVIPGIIIAPKYSTNVSVAQIMAAKCAKISGVFRTTAAVDLDTSQYKTYAQAVEGKLQGGRDSEYLAVCWPLVKSGDESLSYLSVHYAALANRVDAGNDDIPYESASNKILSISSLRLADDTAVDLTLETANELNAQGIVTAVRFNGWRLCGNRTGGFPALSDVKDVFIPIKRMMVWVGNTLTVNFFSRIDNPMNKRLIESIVDSCNIWLNGLAARGVILGGRVSFFAEDNPYTSLLDGKLLFHVYLGLAVPAESITFELQYDTSYFETLFS